MSATPTPITDRALAAAEGKLWDEAIAIVAETSRELERERAALLDLRDQMLKVPPDVPTVVNVKED